MGYSINSSSDNCYEGTLCLINKFGIKDEKKLSEIEANITLLKMTELEQKPIEGNFDFEHYKSIHKYLFEDIYDWAGQIRTIDISKKGTDFVASDQIDIIAKACFERLERNNYLKNLPFDEFIEKIVDFYCTTNMLHPFREGNGRTQRVFISWLIRNAGYDIEFSKIDTDALMIATIKSANGITDDLYAIFKENIIKKNSFDMW